MGSRSPRESVDELRDRVYFLLSGNLGAFPALSKRHSRSRSPIFVGFYAGVLYAIFFCGLPWIKYKDSGPLFWLSVWGSCYLAFASIIAGSTSSSIFEVIENSILPELSDKAIAAIDKDLARRFSTRRVLVVSFLAAIAAVGLSAFALYRDLESDAKPWEIGWSLCGYFILYLTAARTTYIARFYGTFASHLKIDSDRVYALGPAHSAQIVSIASVGLRVLMFWLGIVCSVVTLYPLFVHHIHWFVTLVVPLASFFSVGFGTIVFLNSEHDIRSVVREIAASTLLSTEHEIADLFNRRRSLDELRWKRLQGLMSLHEKVVATGSYRSALVSGLSILVPLVVPVITAAADQWTKHRWWPLK